MSTFPLDVDLFENMEEPTPILPSVQIYRAGDHTMFFDQQYKDPFHFGYQDESIFKKTLEKLPNNVSKKDMTQLCFRGLNDAFYIPTYNPKKLIKIERNGAHEIIKIENEEQKAVIGT